MEKQLPIPEREGTRTFQWNGKDCCLSKREWEETHQFAIKVYEDGEWQPYGVATVTPESVNVKLRKEWVLIKDYSENEGVLDALVAAGIIKEPGIAVETDFVEFPICKVNEETIAEFLCD